MNGPRAHLYQHVDGMPINESFHGEHLLTLVFKELPWFADFANCLVSGVIPYRLDCKQKKKFLHNNKFNY